jgi:hypothetical protein
MALLTTLHKSFCQCNQVKTKAIFYRPHENNYFIFSAYDFKLAFIFQRCHT